jgi:hypothetical protein
MTGWVLVGVEQGAPACRGSSGEHAASRCTLHWGRGRPQGAAAAQPRVPMALGTSTWQKLLVAAHQSPIETPGVRPIGLLALHTPGLPSSPHRSHTTPSCLPGQCDHQQRRRHHHEAAGCGAPGGQDPGGCQPQPGRRGGEGRGALAAVKAGEREAQVRCRQCRQEQSCWSSALACARFRRVGASPERRSRPPGAFNGLRPATWLPATWPLACAPFPRSATAPQRWWCCPGSSCGRRSLMSRRACTHG